MVDYCGPMATVSQIVNVDVLVIVIVSKQRFIFTAFSEAAKPLIQQIRL